MDKNNFELLKATLKSSLKDETLSNEVLNSLDRLRSIDYSLSARRNIFRGREISIYDAVTKSGSNAPINVNGSLIVEIVTYLSLVSTKDTDTLVLELEEVDIQNFSHIPGYFLDYFLVLLYSDFKDPRNYIKESDTKIAGKYLFYTMLHISINKLGVSSTMGLLNEFVSRIVDKTFVAKEDRDPSMSESFFEIFLEEVSYCKANSDYPIEWTLSTVFSKTEGNEIIL